MRKRYSIQKSLALLLALMTAVSLAPAGSLSDGETVSGGTGPVSAMTVKPDFSIRLDEAAPENLQEYLDFRDGVLTVHKGTVEVSNEGTTANRIVVDGDAALILNGVNIQASDGPAIEVKASARLDLTVEGTNTVIGGNQYAGIGVGYRAHDGIADLATLTIDGTGTLIARGSGDGAGIGGSNGCPEESRAKHGRIVINGATVEAYGAGKSAGIGSSNNFRGEGKPSASYKPDKSQNWGDIVINGGNVTAVGIGNGAGIGGGNHNDSGRIVINGGTINAQGDSGIGSGLGSSKGSDKGPGYYYADITINGGDITAYATNNMGAGIGGGMYSDAYVTITGGRIRASVSTGGKTYQSGAGIGGGYQGEAVVRISGGVIEATGGNAGPGIGNGALAAYQVENNSSVKYVRNGAPAIANNASGVFISGGSITSVGGIHGAGIGTGNACDYCRVEITGGSVYAQGGRSDRDVKEGAAGIGSGSRSSSNKPEYRQNTEVHVSISNGTVTAVGGWGAAGIGSGAQNRMADTIHITGGTVEAYADGTKFAIDTREVDGDGKTTSHTAGRHVTVPVLQGTFVHAYEDDVVQNPEGLNSIILEHDATGDADRELKRMPAGYRSFAATVSGSGVYNVYTDSESIGEGRGRYFAEAGKEVYDRDELSDTIQYQVTGNTLSDNFYLYPVKTFVVKKTVEVESGTDLGNLNTTAWFELREDSTQTRWGTPQSIRIKNGVPQNRAFFVNVPDNRYEIWEIDENGRNPMGEIFGRLELKKIETVDSAGSGSNDGTISPEKWTDQVRVVNTFGMPTVDVTVTKTWEDSDNQDGLRPASVTVRLLANGTADGRTAVLSAANSWSCTFGKLDKADENGKEIVYSVREDAVDGYTAAYSGSGLEWHITNTHVPETMTVSGTKTWVDSDDRDGLRPASITVNLLANGVPAASQTVRPDAAGNWRYSFTDLPVNANGRAVVYTVTEEPVKGYTAAVNGYDIVNTHAAEFVTVSGTKTWTDNDDQDGLRPESITVNLLADGVPAASQTVRPDAAGNWRYSFADLPVNADGRAVVYTVTEEPVEGYTATVNGYDLVNAHVPETTAVSGVKTWADNDDQDGLRPESITVNLLADGALAASQTVTPDAAGNWRYSFTELPVNANGQAIVYTVTEEPVEGYTAAVNGYDIVNSHVPAVRTINGTKTWLDQNDRYGLRPDSIRIRLLANGTETANRTVTAAEGWSYSFANLPVNANGAAITYTIVEDAVEHYRTVYDGFDVSNTVIPPRPVSVTLPVVKTSDRDGQILKTGDRIVYTLTVHNSGSVDYTNVRVEDRKTGFQETIPLLRVGETMSFTTDWTVTPEETQAGQVINNVTAQGDPVPDPLDPENPKIPQGHAAHQLLAGEPPATYQVTVYYWYEQINGETAAPTFNGRYTEGSAFLVNSPLLSGYSADVTQVAGTMRTEDLVYHVIYTRTPYRLTIRYVDLNGNTVAPSYEATLFAGDPYSGISPVIEGYVASREAVEGIMPAWDETITVIYTPQTFERNNQTWFTLEDYDTPLGVGNAATNAGEAVE